MNLAILIVILQFHYHVNSTYLPDTPSCISEGIRQYDSSDTGHSDNVNIAAEHQEPAEVLSQLDNTSNLFIGSTSVASVAASGVLLAASGVVCDSSLFSLEIAVSTKLLTSDGARTKTSVSLIKQVALVGQ